VTSPQPILLTIDLGTTNCKAVAFDIDGSTLAAVAVTYPTLNPQEGWYEQRASDWRTAIESSVRSLTQELDEAAEHTAGIALSAWGPGLLLLDAAGEPLNERSPTWQDVRSIEHGRRLVRDAGPDWVGGGMPLTGFPAKLAWAVEAWPQQSARAAQAVGVKEYLLHWLTGELVTEPSSGPYGEEWSARVFDVIGWQRERLPPVVSSTAQVGGLRRDIAGRLGLKPGIPVIAGVNDGAAATLGVGAHLVGDAVVSLGTNGVLRLVTTSPLTAEVCLERSLFRYPLLAELWACGGFVLSGGSALGWLAEAVAAPIETLLAEAASVPTGSDGIVFLPYLVGRGSPTPSAAASAAFAGLRPRHRRGHLTRAVLEGVSFGINDIAEALASLGLHVERLFVTGGGAASALWRSILADVLDVAARHSAGDANLGSAVVLAVGLGLQPDIEAASRALIPPPETTVPTGASIDTPYAAFRDIASRLTDSTGP
jgi:sugar (pentulose or hexulose) kinase